MILKIRGINATSAQGLFKVVATVKSLTAGRNFHSMEQQIETTCCPCCPPWGCVERARRQWKSEHENGGHTRVLLCKLTQLPFCLGVEIVGQVGPVKILLQELEALAKFPAGNLQHGRERLLSIQTDHVRIVLVYAIEDVRQ